MFTARLIPLVALVACTDGTSPKANSVDSGSDVGTDPGTSDLPESNKGNLVGTVTDPDGTPLANVTAQLCSDVCILNRTNDEGHFDLWADEGTWAFEVVVDPTDPASGWSTPLVPVQIYEAGSQSIGPIPVPMLDAIVPLTEAGPVELTPGFTLTADPTEWDAPVLTPSADPWLGAVGFDFATSGLPVYGLEGTILAAWSVAPTGTHPTQAWPLTLANPGLEPGATAEVWVSDYATQAWEPAGTVTVSADGSVLEGAALSTLGLVLLVQPE